MKPKSKRLKPTEIRQYVFRIERAKRQVEYHTVFALSEEKARELVRDRYLSESVKVTLEQTMVKK